MHIEAATFKLAYERIELAFLQAPVVHTESWQGMDISRSPAMRTKELLNFSMAIPLRGYHDATYWAEQIQPNLPWADEHFAERVSGEPLNPAMSYKNWPWATSAERFTDDNKQFNHTYPERLWPKYAGMPTVGTVTPHRGIRGPYGDLMSIVELLVKEPHTRQAWIPLFFPEDTGIGDGGRKPCTLGYQFILRDRQLHIYYPLRSCDYVRHFKDDIYLAIRLGMWIIDECSKRRLDWNDVSLGTYTMHCTSFHIFANDYIALAQKHGVQP